MRWYSSLGEMKAEQTNDFSHMVAVNGRYENYATATITCPEGRGSSLVAVSARHLMDFGLSSACLPRVPLPP